MAYDPDEILTLADQLRLLVEQGMSEDQAKTRLTKLFEFRGKSIYSPKYAVSYEGAVIDFVTGRVVLRRLPRQSFTPTLPPAVHFTLFPSSRSAPDLTDAAQQSPLAGATLQTPAGKPTAPQTKRAAFVGWMTKRYPRGIPPGTTAKMLAKEFSQDTRVVVNERTVRRALGRK